MTAAIGGTAMSGVVVDVFSSSGFLLAQTTTAANGTYQLSITDTAKTPFLIFVGVPLRAPKLVATLVTASYGP